MTFENVKNALKSNANVIYIELYQFRGKNHSLHTDTLNALEIFDGDNKFQSFLEYCKNEEIQEADLYDCDLLDAEQYAATIWANTENTLKDAKDIMGNDYILVVTLKEVLKREIA